MLLDIRLPLLSRYETARRIRDTLGKKHNPLLIAITDWGQKEDRRRSRAGFDHHLVKPTDPAASIALIASKLSTRDDADVRRRLRVRWHTDVGYTRYPAVVSAGTMRRRVNDAAGSAPAASMRLLGS